jgi:hypothetical protein
MRPPVHSAKERCSASPWGLGDRQHLLLQGGGSLLVPGEPGGQTEGVHHVQVQVQVRVRHPGQGRPGPVEGFDRRGQVVGVQRAHPSQEGGVGQSGMDVQPTGQILALVQQPHAGGVVALPEREVAAGHESPGTRGCCRGGLS